jgi:heptosyltransferase-2
MSPARSTAIEAPRRILVVRTRFVGDTVLAIPFLRNLRREFSQARIDVLVEKGAGSVLADCPYKDELIVAPGSPAHGGALAGLKALRTNAAWLRARGYDRAYVLKRAVSSILPVWLAGIPHRVGFAEQGGGLLLSRAVPIRKHRHEVEVFLDLLRADSIPVDDGHNENWVAADAARKVDTILRDLSPGRAWVFVAPRSTATEKEWPVERMAGVVSWLVATRGCDVFFCGAPRDMAMHSEIAGLAGHADSGRVHDLTNDLDLRHTGALLARMDLCLGIDTGLLHVAASYGVPVVALFGPTDPNQWCPWGTEVEVLRSPRTVKSLHERLHEAFFPATVAGLGWPIGAADVRDIGVDEVIGAADRLLAGAGRALACAG